MTDNLSTDEQPKIKRLLELDKRHHELRIAKGHLNDLRLEQQKQHPFPNEWELTARIRRCENHIMLILSQIEMQ